MERQAEVYLSCAKYECHICFSARHPAGLNSPLICVRSRLSSCLPWSCSMTWRRSVTTRCWSKLRSCSARSATSVSVWWVEVWIIVHIPSVMCSMNTWKFYCDWSLTLTYKVLPDCLLSLPKVEIHGVVTANKILVMCLLCQLIWSWWVLHGRNAFSSAGICIMIHEGLKKILATKCNSVMANNSSHIQSFGFW